MALPSHLDTRNTHALALLRIGVGLLFLIFGQYKVFGTAFTLHGGFQSWINKFLEGGAYPFMVPVLREFVLPHATAIAFLVAYGEFAIGLGLTAGVLVRSASFGGLILMLTMLFSSDYPGAGAPFWQYFGASLSPLRICSLFCCVPARTPGLCLVCCGPAKNSRGRRRGEKLVPNRL